MRIPPLSLYIHIPWCIRKCPYCDFNSHASPSAIPEQAYIKALQRDLQANLHSVQDRPLQSIFFGGGTPSLFSADGIRCLLEYIADQLQWSDKIEITLEANPGTMDQARFLGYRQAGVNRISLGAQSFNDRHLRNLGRIHNAAEIHQSIEHAQSAGFDRINLDLMYGLPGQDVTQAMTDLHTALNHQPSHISWYELTIEPNTVFYNRPPELPREQTLVTLEDAGHALLADHGYQRYEIAAFRRSKREGSTHNLNYWQFGDYIGIGAGAHGKMTIADQGSVIRQWQTRSPKDYLDPASALIAGSRRISDDELPLEFMMNALRLSDGVPMALFSERTGLKAETIAAPLVQLIDQGLLKPGSQLCTTERGYRMLDGVLQAFA